MADDVQQGRAIQQHDGLPDLLSTNPSWLVRWASLLIVIKAILSGRLIQGRNIELKQLARGLQINALVPGAEVPSAPSGACVLVKDADGTTPEPIRWMEAPDGAYDYIPVCSAGVWTMVKVEDCP